MKKVLLKIFTWFFWKHFLSGLKSVLGHSSLSSSIKEMKETENMLRNKNDIKYPEQITWKNVKRADYELLAKYITLKYFNQIGELLVFFMFVDKKKILEEK